MSGKRGNREGSMYPYKDGWAAYVWVTTPSGALKRKYVTSKDRDKCHAKWIELQAKAAKGPVDTDVESVGQYAHYWLEELVKPNLTPGTYDNYARWVRLQIEPGIGSRRLDKLRVRDIQVWLNKVAGTCQCCYQGKDSARAEDKRQCCAIGKCCKQLYTKSSLQGLRRALRAMLGCAVVDEKLDKNLGSLTKITAQRKHKTRRRRWSSEDARKFLVSARVDEDRYYLAFVFILVYGMRRGEALGFSDDEIDLARDRLEVAWQIQRVGTELLRREVKTEDSEDYLPLLGICRAAVELRYRQRDKERQEAGNAWHESGLVITTPLGSVKDPRNFLRDWYYRCDKAGVPRISIRDARRTCASILADLDVHPRIAMRILRHSKITVTMEVYTKVSDEATITALKRLETELG
ncbi:tyrosine-type recombinase/integrase [Glycomyces niveus]|uniref:Site-specific integrase n=1 Tax=Glycomyces niveus TaxID=2820287 RepID=A0ABS3UCP5_9ACTN|nr:site-specific integrase [Glycomyces sp. NEAU-S30]MBO3735528.1 site-specific integrase [Glycomyces sp. NEAU-S30]